MVLLPLDEPEPRDGAQPPASPTAAASRTPAAATTTAPPAASPTGLALPTGWRMHQDRTGFSVAVPADWRESRVGTIVYFREPRGGRVLGIDQTDTPKSDPLSDWQRQEKARVANGDWRDYQRVQIVRVDYRDYNAADWEFTYAGSGGRLHVVNRNFITAPDKAYAIYWSTPDSTWAANLDEFALITDSFRPER